MHAHTGTASETLATIDGRRVSAPEGATILEAALGAGIHIPHLCHDPRLAPTGACRLCLVEIEGQRGLHTSCTRRLEPGMVVRTQTEAVRNSRRTTLELLLSEHCVDCLTCDRDGACLLQDYSYDAQADQYRFPNVMLPPDQANFTTGNHAIAYDPSKCVRCQRCVRYCAEVQMAEAITMTGRGAEVEVSTGFGLALNDSTCVLCGGCVGTCPTAALHDRQAMGLGRCGGGLEGHEQGDGGGAY